MTTITNPVHKQLIANIRREHQARQAASGSIESQRASLRRQTVSAPVRSTKVTASSASLSEAIQVYTIAPGTPKSDIQNVLWFFHFSNMSKKSKGVLQWQNLLASWCYNLYSGVFQGVQPATYEIHQITPAQLANIKIVVDTQFTPNSREIPDLRENRKTAKGELKMFDLPEVVYTDMSDVHQTMEMGVWYGLLGVLALAAAKDVAGKGGKALTENRFKALKGKYGWDDTVAAPLSSKYRPSVDAFKGFSAAWVRLVAYKKALFTSAAALLAQKSGAEDDAFLTTVKMMRYADLTHVTLIHEFLSQYYWVGSIPSLAADVNSYYAGLQQLLNACDVLTDTRGRELKDAEGNLVRDTACMPYLKMIYGDSLDLAKRDTMKKLLFVAWSVLKESSPTLSEYEVADRFPPILAEFDAWRSNVDTVEESEEEESEPEEE